MNKRKVYASFIKFFIICCFRKKLKEYFFRKKFFFFFLILPIVFLRCLLVFNNFLNFIKLKKFTKFKKKKFFFTKIKKRINKILFLNKNTKKFSLKSFDFSFKNCLQNVKIKISFNFRSFHVYQCLFHFIVPLYVFLIVILFLFNFTFIFFNCRLNNRQFASFCKVI